MSEQMAATRDASSGKIEAARGADPHGFLELEGRAFSSGALSRKTKELIATGISVSMDCATCMEWHISACATSGATSHEVLEAIEVGMVLGGGRATVAGRVALLVLEDVFDGDG